MTASGGRSRKGSRDFCPASVERLLPTPFPPFSAALFRGSFPRLEWRPLSTSAFGSAGFRCRLNPREHPCNDPLDARASKFMFPNANDAPPSGLERSRLSQIAVNRRLHLLIPPCRVGLWKHEVQRTAVPKAPVYK